VNLRTSLVDPDFLPVIWPYINAMVATAASYADDGTTPQVLYERATKGSETRFMVMHRNNDLIGVGALQYDNDGELYITNLSYHNVSKEEVLNELIGIANSLGATSIKGAGRKGWGRYLKSLGFKQIGKDTVCLNLNQSNNR
jgi:hypothetical protein